jgi:hypothetical protein
MATQNATLSCTGTGTASYVSMPDKVLTAVATAIPSKVAMPIRILTVVSTAISTKLSSPIRTLSATATNTSRLLKSPIRVLKATGSNAVVVFLERFGASAWDELQCSRKWFHTEAGKWSLAVTQRFKYVVRGRL